MFEFTANDVEVMIEKVNNIINEENEVIYSIEDVYNQWKEVSPSTTEMEFYTNIVQLFSFMCTIGTNFANEFAISEYTSKMEECIETVTTNEEKDILRKVLSIHQKYYFGKIVYNSSAFHLIDRLKEYFNFDSLEDKTDSIYFIVGHERRHSIQSRRMLEVGSRISFKAFAALAVDDNNIEARKKYYEALHERDANRSGNEFMMNMINKNN